jgi:hypothetical protein
MKSEWLKFHSGCLDIPKNECRLKFDHDRPAPEDQLEDKNNLKQWVEKDNKISKQLKLCVSDAVVFLPLRSQLLRSGGRQRRCNLGQNQFRMCSSSV